MKNNAGLLKENERLDDLGREGLFLIQNPEYFCFGIDAVLLSSFAKVHAKEKVIDLCSGNGIIPVLLSAKTKAESITGLEIQYSLYDMANRSIEYNNIGNRVKMVLGDVKRVEDLFPKLSFDVVSVNPPYMKKEAGLVNDSDKFRIARHEEMCTFEDIIGAANCLLRPKGRLYMVHRPFRLVELLKTMSEMGIEPKSMRLVMPYADKEPNLVLIEGIKDAKPELRIAPPLIVYNKDGSYTEEVKDIYGYE